MLKDGGMIDDWQWMVLNIVARECKITDDWFLEGMYIKYIISMYIKDTKLQKMFSFVKFRLPRKVLKF